MGYLDIIILFLSCVFEIYIYDDFCCAFSEFRSDNQTLGKRFFFGLLAVICLIAIKKYIILVPKFARNTSTQYIHTIITNPKILIYDVPYVLTANKHITANKPKKNLFPSV